MGRDPGNAIMLDDDDDDREVRGRQQASLDSVEYIDLQDNKHYKSRAYAPPSTIHKDSDIPTSWTRTNQKIEEIRSKAVIHDRGPTSHNQDRCQPSDIADSHRDVPMNGMRDLADVKARKDTTNSPGARNSRQQLRMTMTGNGADVKLDALSRDSQWGPMKHAKANATNTTLDYPTVPRKRPHMCMTVDLRESDLSSDSEAAKSPRPRLTSLQPFRREQVHNGIANEGPDSNADTASSHPPQGKQNAQARPSNAPKMGFAALQTVEKARPAPFGTLKIATSSQGEEEDQLFFPDRNDRGQEGDQLCFQDPNVPGPKSYATQQKDVGKQGSPWIKQIARQTHKSSRGNHHTNKNASRKELGRLAREFAPTEVCGVFSESRVPAGCNPAQHIPGPSALKKTRNMTCIICGSKFEVKLYVRNHFPKCVQKNGNPNRHSWFDHPTVRSKDEFGSFSKKTDDEPAIEPSSSLPGFQADSPTTGEHKTTGGKGISDATIASWLAAQSKNEEGEGEDDHNAETKMETSESAWQYHVTRQEIRTADLGLEDPIERKYTPYWTLEEANAKAGEEIQIRDVSPSPGPHPGGWSLQFRKDENGMDSHTVEVQGTTISTTVTRSKSSSSNATPSLVLIAQFSLQNGLTSKSPALIPRAELAKHRMPASAFIAPPTIYTILSISIHHTSINVEIKTHGHYTLRTKANERAGELWVEQFAEMEAKGAVEKYDLEREIRRVVRELAEVEGGLFDRIVGKHGEGEGAKGRVWVVEEVVRGPRN